MKRKPRIRLEVIIQQTQDGFDIGRKFGTSEGWARVIKEKLEAVTYMADIISVKPLPRRVK